MKTFPRNRQYFKFCAYGFLKNLRFFDAFLLLFFIEKGISFTEIGILYAVREIIINVVEVPSGIIADTYGRKNALLASFIFYIISFLLFYIYSTFIFFLLAMVLYGVAEAFRSGTHKGMIMDYLKLNGWGDLKVDYYGHTRSWSQLGSAISALIAGLLVLYSGKYQIIFVYSIFPYLINFINIATYPVNINFSIDQNNGSRKIGLKSTFQSFLKVVKMPKVLQIMNSSALHSAFLKSVKDYIQPLMVQVVLIVPFLMHLDGKKKGGLIIGILYFFIFLLTSYASRISYRVLRLDIRHLSNKTLLVGLLAGVLCGILYQFEYSVLSLLFFIFIYVNENLRKPLLTGEIADQVPNEILTSVLSTQSFLATILTSLLAVLMGLGADLYGIGTALFVVSSALLVLTIVLGFLSRKRTASS